MNKKELEAFAREAAKTIKTESDRNDFRQMLTQIIASSYGLPWGHFVFG